MMRLLSMRPASDALFGAALLVCGPALAGDYAKRDIHGFSPDSRYFALEQYGVEDGSGFAYIELFVIDTENDSWVDGFPVINRIEDESITLDSLRESFARERIGFLENFEIGDPGDHLASNPRAELNADPFQVVVNAAHRFTPPREELVTFSLSEKELTSDRCPDFTGQPLKGFTLTMLRNGEDAVTMQDDERLPESRGCPLGYAIADVVSHENDGVTTYAVLLHVEKIGFEGPDGRFMAVTVRVQ